MRAVFRSVNRHNIGASSWEEPDTPILLVYKKQQIPCEVHKGMLVCPPEGVVKCAMVTDPT